MKDTVKQLKDSELLGLWMNAVRYARDAGHQRMSDDLRQLTEEMRRRGLMPKMSEEQSP